MLQQFPNALRRYQYDLFATLPPPWPEDPLPAIQAALQDRHEVVVVLDDDPTGTQTVHGVPVLTKWSTEGLAAAFAGHTPALYILTNSRSMTPDDARALTTTIGHALVEAAQMTKRRFVVVSRSDSTLRGHFPEEVESLELALDHDIDAWLLIPFFEAGGRYTINDTHYVAEGSLLVPAAETAFARDATFGYRSSNLRQWVIEKAHGRIPSEAVASVSLEDIRLGGPQCVAERLMHLPRRSVCIVNAASTHDLAVFTHGLLIAEACGRRYLYRTAASFVPLRAGIAPRPLLKPAELDLPHSRGGLIVVGSYVPTTSAQMQALWSLPHLHRVEVAVPALLDEQQREARIHHAAEEVETHLQAGADVVLFTSRQLITGMDADSSLEIGRRVSACLVEIVSRITVRPRYVLAKGGITSSDIATSALGVQQALVRGQILPGVPVWQLGVESRHPDLAYIVFPGNVGSPTALAEVVTALR